MFGTELIPPNQPQKSPRTTELAFAIPLCRQHLQKGWILLQQAISVRVTVSNNHHRAQFKD